MEIATLSAGCFWGVEAKFQQLEGIKSTRVGYSSGHTDAPTYELICTGTTGHAEVIELTFDPDIISFEQILDVFWLMHDPTTLNRQGPDRGTQYRSGIFYHNELQQRQAENSKQALDSQHYYVNAIVTEITAASHFYPAEGYHQCYVQKKSLSN